MRLEAELEDLKKVKDGEDTAAIKAATEKLTQTSYEIFGKVYQQTQGQAGPNGGEQAGQGQQGGYQDGSVDADYTVEDDK